MTSARKAWWWRVPALLAALIGNIAQAAPANDNWVGRTPIGTLPFTQSLPGVEDGSSESSDPELFCVILGLATPGANTVWYEFTTGSSEQFVDISAAGYDTLLGVYEGSPAGGFSGVRGGCNDDGAGGQAGSRIIGLRLRANTRYSIVVARYPPNTAPSMTLNFSMQASRVYNVTKTADTADGVCDADCSLREALVSTNTAPGAVVLPAGTYPIQTGLVARSGGAIYGAGMADSVIDANQLARVLTHSPGTNATFALHDLSLVRGNASGHGGAFAGSGGHYVFENVALRDSSASVDGGGGFFSEGSTVSMYSSVVSGNRSGGNGGGIDCNGDNIEIHDSSFFENESLSTQPRPGGGAIYFEGRNETRLVNSTISRNRTSGEGGGVYLDLGGPSQKTIINNNTIVDNFSGPSADPARQGGLLVIARVASSRSTRISNNVIARNMIDGVRSPGAFFDCAFTGSIAPALWLNSYNLVQAPNSCTLSGAGNQTGLDPLLQPLQVDLSLPVHLPAGDSPLIDAGDPADGCTKRDARGFVRPRDGNGDGSAVCDIGAVEIQPDTLFADGFEE